jgi:ABC-type sugar transport system ATPase subunit
MEVRISGLRFGRGGRTVLDVPSLTFAAGERTAVLGPNGAGKTTLLRVVAGLERPEAGVVEMRGEAVRQPVAFGFQEAVFLRGTVRSNMELALRLAGVPRGEHGERVAAAAAVCGVSHLLERKATRLSGGEARRASLARTLCLRAPVTLLDEPLAGLDAESRRQLLADLPGILDALAATVVVVTHDRDEAVRLANQMVVMVDGQVRASGECVEVLRRPPDGETAVFLGYTRLVTGGRAVAVAPGALRLGAGEVEFALRVTGVAEFGWMSEVRGEVDGVAVGVRAEAGAGCGVGEVVTVSAAKAAVIPLE